MAASSSTSRLAGLPRIPKVPKKAPKRKSASPPKPKAKPLPPPPPPPRPLAPAAAPFPLNPSDDDTLSDVSSSSSDSDVMIEPAKPKTTTNGPAAKDKGKGPATAPKAALAHFPSGLAALPALPSLPPLPSLPAKAKSLATASAAPKPFTAASSAAAKPSGPSATAGPIRPVPRPVKRKDTNVPSPDVLLTSHAPVASTSKASTPRAAASPSPSVADNAPYAPHHSSARSTPSAPQRMSLRQVLALSLQEAEEKAKSQPTSRENSPDATELGRVSAGTSAFGKKDRADRSTSHPSHAGHRRVHHAESGKGKGKERLSDVSDFELAEMDDASALDTSSSADEAVDEAAAAGDAKALERAEERQIRAELRRKRPRRSADAMELDIRFGTAGETDTTDEEDLALAWDRNVRALERLHSRTAQQVDQMDTYAFADDGEDSDVAVTNIPVGNGAGVVTWSDYEFDDEDEMDEEGGDIDDADEDQPAAALADSDQSEDDDNSRLAAGDFEDELEQLFALSEAAAGPINPSEYDFGNVWLEALSGSEGGSDGDDESGSDEDNDDSDADMIFGPDGELKESYGWGLADDVPAIALGASADSASALGSARPEDQALRSTAGAAVVTASTELSTSEEETLSESTDSSCSDTDIYRYAPRTGALAAVQAPTSADLASLGAGELSAPLCAKPQSEQVRERKHKAKAQSSLASIPERAVQPAPKGPPAIARGPVMGSFEPVTRNAEDVPVPLKVVIVDESGVPAPSPFAAPVKPRRRIPSATPSRRVRSDSRVSTTSGTSGAESVDFGSNVGSPVLANVVFDFDFDSVLHKSLLNSSDDEDGDVEMGGGDSSETDTGAAGQSGPASQATSALADFSRWARIPIGAFRSRTTGGPTGPALSQVFAAQAAESGKSRKHGSTGSRAGTTPAMLRDRKAVDSLHHTLGSPGQATAASKRAIANRMLTSPVLAPTIRESARPTATAGHKRVKAQKPKRVKSTSSKKALSRG